MEYCACMKTEKLPENGTVVSKHSAIYTINANFYNCCIHRKWSTVIHNKYIIHCIQGVPGGMDKTSGECSLG